MEAVHERLGLTPRQTEVYALCYEGRTQAEVAAILKIHQSRVSRHIANAIARNPNLPALSDHRRHRTTNLSAYSNEAGNGLADVLGLN